ncbi:unnamed protein product [Mycena citricolor]|uniref:Uncharacterized protein n=1 Tax=Mycena citricolor TaxID=2018698 RepID=A0AAD2JYW1_9AGAR|nr:unnamed protein product [Mycena citricolor]
MLNQHVDFRCGAPWLQRACCGNLHRPWECHNIPGVSSVDIRYTSRCWGACVLLFLTPSCETPGLLLSVIPLAMDRTDFAFASAHGLFAPFCSRKHYPFARTFYPDKLSVTRSSLFLLACRVIA